MTASVVERKGATLTVSGPAISRCPAEVYCEFSMEMSVLGAFIVASGGWLQMVQMPHMDALRVECVGEEVDVDNLVELVRSFNEKWSA